MSDLLHRIEERAHAAVTERASKLRTEIRDLERSRIVGLDSEECDIFASIKMMATNLALRLAESDNLPRDVPQIETSMVSLRVICAALKAKAKQRKQYRR